MKKSTTPASAPGKKPITKVAVKAAKVSSTKKAATDKPIKYQDKSPGQPELVPIFKKVSELIERSARAPLKINNSQPGTFSAESPEPVHILGKERQLYFAGAMVQKGYVGFYFFPIYTDPAIGKELPAELMKCLKGKSCFHIKKDDPQLMEQIEDALAKGYAL